MDPTHWLELVLFLAIIAALAKPMGNWLYNVLDPNSKTGLEWVVGPLEKWTYRLCQIDPSEQQDWKRYTLSIFFFTLVCFIFTFCILSFQNVLPLNPEMIPAMTFIENLNASISFVSNTCWECYTAEKEITCFSKMFAFTTQNFCSAGVGICVGAALTRGIAASSQKMLGNFWVDIIRICYYVLLPLGLIMAVIFVAEGSPQNFKTGTTVQTLEGEKQWIPQGPIASLEAIKLVGSNGAGATRANSANPYENPTPVSNFLQTLAILLIPAGQIFYFGKMVHNTRHAWSIFAFMVLLFALGTSGIATFEARGNPFLSPGSCDLTEGNMEGKEQRFSIFDTALFANASTAAQNGSINSRHSSYLPWSQAITLQNMQIGNLIFGGVGSGLYRVLNLVIISTFFAGLVTGRVPQYLGKKIEAFEIRMCMIPVIIFIIGISGLTALSFLTKLEDLSQRSPQGFTAMLYAFSSTMSTNGSSYGGTSFNTPAINLLTSISMIAGRYLIIWTTIALAGSLSLRKKHSGGTRAIPVTGVTFVILILSVFFLINALGFLPSILLGPAYEQVLLIEGKMY